jgi:hypothetical protein
MAKFSMKQGGKEVGNADIYAKPHTMSGGEAKSQNDGSFRPDPNTLAADKTVPGGSIPARRVSLGDRIREPKTTGIKTRGNGAATKGVIARGPMA